MKCDGCPLKFDTTVCVALDDWCENVVDKCHLTRSDFPRLKAWTEGRFNCGCCDNASDKDMRSGRVWCVVMNQPMDVDDFCRNGWQPKEGGE